jgi:hypothetical protein
VHVAIGPVPASSATAWITFARTVLTGSGRRDQRVDVALGEDVATAFHQYLDEWEDLAASAARSGGDFKWAIEIDVEQVEYLVHAFYRIAEQMAAAAEARGRTIMPPEAAEFYASLVTGLLDGLDEEGQSASVFATELRRFWPGLAPEATDST